LYVGVDVLRSDWYALSWLDTRGRAGRVCWSCGAGAGVGGGNVGAVTAGIGGLNLGDMPSFTAQPGTNFGDMDAMFGKTATNPELTTEGFNPFDAPLFDSDEEDD